MRELVLRSDIYHFATCQEFAEEFNLGKNDLVLTNEYIFSPFFGKLGLEVQTLFQENYGTGEPTDVMVDEIIRATAKTSCKRIVAVGGGTIIDIAKILAVTDGALMDELYGNAAYLEKKRELIIIPTTCGTGSEVTNLSIINRVRLGTKMGLGSDKMFADSAVLIPQLLSTLPYGVFATSSIDALVHAVESSLSPKATPYSQLFGYKAIGMIIKGYQDIVRNGKDALTANMENFLIASNYAGIAFGTAGCAAVHALSYPLGGTYHVPHGESNYAIFTGVLKNYMEIRQDGEISRMNEYLSGLLGCSTGGVYDELENLLNKILQKKALREYGVTEQDLDDFTSAVITKQQRLMNNNFVPLDAVRVRKIYTELY